jgi:hypothetical protein
VVDQGARSSVTAGKNLDGFRTLVEALVRENGRGKIQLHLEKRAVTLPGFFRPTKQWDMLLMKSGQLVAALELKSQVGPSFGNNFNNRTEESLGSALDFWTAFREGAFGDSQRPFLGYLVLLEDCGKSRSVVRADSPHFLCFPEFENTSYAARYDLLCRKLVREKLYDAAALVLTSRDEAEEGRFSEISASSGLRRWVAALSAAISAAAEW